MAKIPKIEKRAEALVADLRKVLKKHEVLTMCSDVDEMFVMFDDDDNSSFWLSAISKYKEPCLIYRYPDPQKWKKLPAFGDLK